MGRARAENCTHPSKRRERTAYGRYACGRCGTDTTPTGRIFEVRHSDRVTLCYGDRVAVSRECHSGGFQGLFLWAEQGLDGVIYHVVELHRWRHEGVTREDWAQHRFISPEYVRRAPGVRDREARAAA